MVSTTISHHLNRLWYHYQHDHGFRSSVLVMIPDEANPGAHATRIPVVKTDSALLIPSPRCYQTLPSSPSASINNALFIHPSPRPSSRNSPRVLVSNNARLIEVYDVKGAAPDAARARQRRRRKRWARPVDDGDDQAEEEMPDEEGVEETGPCELEKVVGAEVYLSTQVNHCECSS